MLSFFAKLLFIIKRPKIIIIAGRSRDLAAEAIFNVLKSHVKISLTGNSIGFINISRNRIVLAYLDFSSEKVVRELHWMAQKSPFVTMVVTHFSSPRPDKDFFDSSIEDVVSTEEFAKTLRAPLYLILNFDDETVRNTKTKVECKSVTFGFQDNSDFRSTDTFITQSPVVGTNFKINYKGSIVPVWLECLFGKENIYAALAAAAVGEIFGIHLVEVSQALKYYKGLSGRMQLVKGIKNSLILDDSAGSSAPSMREALDVLGKIEANRKIAVLGDVVDVGKYTIEAHEALGSVIPETASILFTVGARAKFIAEGAKNRGFSEENIFSFDNAKEASDALKDKIQKGDLILVDGSTEMQMSEVVKALRA